MRAAGRRFRLRVSYPTRRGAGGVVLWSGFGGAGTWLWGLGGGMLLVLAGLSAR